MLLSNTLSTITMYFTIFTLFCSAFQGPIEFKQCVVLRNVNNGYHNHFHIYSLRSQTCYLGFFLEINVFSFIRIHIVWSKTTLQTISLTHQKCFHLFLLAHIILQLHRLLSMLQLLSFNSIRFLILSFSLVCIAF